MARRLLKVASACGLFRLRPRRVFVQEGGPHPVLWVGSNHGASIVRNEPLD